MIQNRKLIISGVVLSSLSLSQTSCYFNSAGHIFDKASHQAAVCVDDAKADGTQYVYEHEGEYYIELPRYRFDAPVQTQISLYNQASDKKELELKGKEMYKIPSDFAKYLMGKASSPKVPKNITAIDNDDEIKAVATTYPIRKNAGTEYFTYEYKSPNAGWYYTLGVFDWLCVDLPITCAENAIFGCMAICAAGQTNSSGSSSTSTKSSLTAYERQQMKEDLLQDIKAYEKMIHDINQRLKKADTISADPKKRSAYKAELESMRQNYIEKIKEIEAGLNMYFN